VARTGTKRTSWRELLSGPDPLLLPCAHDALSARLIERAGFRAYSIGGFPLVGARYGLPDIGLVGLGEMTAGVRDIVGASELAVLVDGDHGYGDAKNVARTIRTYEAMGVAAIFIEDQVAPKRCGHMAGKDVVPTAIMEEKLRAAAAAREQDTFLLARTDARAIHGLDEALRRGERYLRAGADGIFIEAPETLDEMRIVGRAFKGVPQLANMLEGGRTPLVDPKELKAMGFAMIAYPTTLIFRVARTIEKALADLAAGRLALEGEGVDFAAFKAITGFEDWVKWETIAVTPASGRKSTAA
jgi:2-methylisocitrate lyase-like PEP mutase family enzyme